ncbi:ribonuclease domain-containing protein [Corynebacterium meitnerae]|uniref:Ribonuclease n=1 Tax=Corynebacterium meitnerae TaxID=2913498 RepID=A0A9X3LTL5_9CORY|nr:ribonuclease domain-containing protein [Corynebacterium meitnerae]MCZ9293399.1 ribonuclease [Corynebacterium meitnerae]
MSHGPSGSSASNDGDSTNRRTPAFPLLSAITLITMLAIGYSALHDDGVRECGPRQVPEEAFSLIDDIHSNSPLPYPATDGGHFGNYENELPQEHSNYYREYTVPTPGRTGRGERRLVTGGGTPQDPDVYYYTWDHYESFCEIPESDVE